MKKILCLFFSIVMAFSILTTVPFTSTPFNITASAANSGSCGKNAKWSLSSGILKITGSGEMTDTWYEDAPWYDKRDSIKSIVISDGITSIGQYAFTDCKNLTSVKFPDSIESIGRFAFECCIKLKSITLPESLYIINESAFLGCKTITSVSIPKNVKTIGYGSFSECTSLKTIKIPDTVENIGYWAFNNTAYYNNKSNWENKALYIGKHLITTTKVDNETGEILSRISGEYTVKSGTKTIADNTFYGCNELISVSLPYSVKQIGNDAFYDCIKLRKIKVSSKNKYYSSSDGVLFSKSKDILIKYPESKTATSYTVPKTVETIKNSAFSSADKLVSVTVSEGVEKIELFAFSYCSKLKTIKLPDSLYDIGQYAFTGTAYYDNKDNWSDKILYIGKHLIEAAENFSRTSYTVKSGTKSIAGCAFSNVKKLSSVTLPKSLIGIGFYAFANRREMTSIKLPSRLKFIGLGAFIYSGLKSVTIPSKVKRIHDATFMYSNISSVKIPNSVTRIDSTAFANCENLKTVTIPSSVKKIGTKAFGYNKIDDYDSSEKIVYKKVKSFTIKGGADTAAEKYANANNFTFKEITKPATVKLGKISNTSSGIKITWSEASRATKYVVYRKSGSGSYEAIKTVTTTYYTDTTAKSGKKYTYTVKGKNAAGLGKYNKTGLTIVCT